MFLLSPRMWGSTCEIAMLTRTFTTTPRERGDQPKQAQRMTSAREFRDFLPDHIFTTISPPKWAMIKYLETTQDQPIPAPRRDPALNKDRTVHPNPENNRAAPG